MILKGSVTMFQRPNLTAPDGANQADIMSSSTHQIADQSEVEDFLMSPMTYGLADGRVERIDTHAAIVFLAGERAFKIKRAVKYPYLDFSTLAKRREACLHEVELNRRTAPGLYLGVAGIRRDLSGQLYMGAADAAKEATSPVEYAVVMKRFDREAELDHMASCNALSDDLLKDLACAIAAFHEAAAPHVTGFDHAAGFAGIVRGNDLAFDEYSAHLPRAESLALTEKSLAVIEANAALFAARQAQGKVRHCHGDLHLANIVMIDEKPVLFDAIEFDDQIAIIDVLYDLAFLLMDLCQEGREREANVIFNHYLSETRDFTALPLLPLFLSVRASIRAKVSAAQGRFDEAGAYFRRAGGFLEDAEPCCVAVGGLSGSGKTTLARALAPFIGAAPGAIHLRSDVIRKELSGVAETERLPQSAYSSAVTEKVYAVMIGRAREVLSNGHSVIVDAVFSKPAEREAVEAMARALSVTPQCFWLSAPEDTLKARVAARRRDASDATPAVVEQQMSYDLGDLSWQQVDSRAALGDMIGQVLNMVNGNSEAE